MANPANMATSPDSAQAYIDSLGKQLANAKLDLDKALALQASAQLEHAKTQAWKTLICACHDALEQTNLQASLLIDQLATAKTQAELVGKGADFGAQAFLHLLSDLKMVACCIESLKSKVPAGNKTPGNAVSDACEKLAAALADAMKCAEAVIKAMLETYEKGQKLLKGVGDPGLYKSLCIVHDHFTAPGPTPDHTTCADCSDAEKPVFPLDEKQPGFYKDVADGCAQADIDLAAALLALQAAQKEKNKQQTCYDALKAAYDAAVAAKACKK